MDWCDSMTFELERYGSPMILRDENDWRVWATEALRLIEASRTQLTPLNPYQYDDWRIWAQRFIDATEAPAKTTTTKQPVPPVSIAVMATILKQWEQSYDTPYQPRPMKR
jgi:hypothetical protein